MSCSVLFSFVVSKLIRFFFLSSSGEIILREFLTDLSFFLVEFFLSNLTCIDPVSLVRAFSILYVPTLEFVDLV